jgi:tRNA nucleotidyltransferase (CCA-adding enzyme)
VTANVLIKGGVLGFINLSESYGVENLAVNESFSTTLHPFGFGPITIEILATASDAKGSYLKGQMSVILFLVYPIIPPYEIMEENQ